MPYACYHLGIYIGLAACFLMGLLSHASTMMHLKVKDLTPRRYESMYEIAYLLVGRPSIFFVCIIMFLSNFGACVMYYMIIGETISALLTQTMIGDDYYGMDA